MNRDQYMQKRNWLYRKSAGAGALPAQGRQAGCDGDTGPQSDQLRPASDVSERAGYPVYRDCPGGSVAGR